MGLFTPLWYPVLVELIHNDVVDHTISTEWGDIDVYIIRTIHYQNQTGDTWAFVATDAQGHDWSGQVGPFEEGTLNLPVPRRFESEPLNVGISFVRV